MSRIYLITPPEFQVMSLTNLPAVLEAGDVACLQLRLKNAGDDEWKRAAAALKLICAARGIPLLLNDRADLVKETGADGVHLGEDDTLYSEARKLLGADKLIGVSCYARKDFAMEAAAAGADYVAFGSVFPSGTKNEAPLVPLEVLEDWAAFSTTPCAAIGGITSTNCAPLVRAGVDFLAVIGAVWNYPEGPVAGIKKLHEAIISANSAPEFPSP